MEKGVVWMFVFVLLAGVVCAGGEWGDIGDGDNVSNVTAVVGDSDDDSGGENSYVVEDVVTSVDGGSGKMYTINFYIALGFGVIGLSIVAYFVYLFIRYPKNRWK
jgi:hypothetical protein